MYDKLVSRIRFACKIIEGPTADLLTEAADAIEKLQYDIDIAVRAEAAATEACKPRWIPVTERLPEDGSDILAYHAVDSRIVAANYYKGTWQDSVMGRLYLTEEGFITHWMPLPEPPKEEA